MDNVPSTLIVNLGFYGGTFLFLAGAVLLVTVLAKAKKAKQRRERRAMIREQRARDLEQERKDWVKTQMIKQATKTVERQHAALYRSLQQTQCLPQYNRLVAYRPTSEADTNVIPRYSDSTQTAIIPVADRSTVNGLRQTRE